MKKSYITPQTIMVCGAYNTQILAGSDGNTGSGGGTNGEGTTGNETKSETGSGTGVDITGHAKQNAWESWD